VLAWNLEGFLTNRLESDPRRAAAWRGGLLLGRALTVALIVGLVICAWPGWLQPGPGFEPRRWAVEPYAALEHGAQATKRWIEAGRLGPKPRILHLSADSANVFAWFCPEAEPGTARRLA